MRSVKPHKELEGLTLEQLIACPDCDLLMKKPDLEVQEQVVICPCCGRKLYTIRANVATKSLALVLTALLLYIPANFLPIMYLNLVGRVTTETVWSGVWNLYDSGMSGLAVIVFTCSMAVPLLKLLCQLLVLVSVIFARFKNYGLFLYRTYHHLKEWGMLEVYLLGILVSIIKLGDMADLELGVGLLCFISLLVVQIWLEIMMSPQQIWQSLSECNNASH